MLGLWSRILRGSILDQSEPSAEGRDQRPGPLRTKCSAASDQYTRQYTSFPAQAEMLHYLFHVMGLQMEQHLQAPRTETVSLPEDFQGCRHETRTNNSKQQTRLTAAAAPRSKRYAENV